MPAFLFEDNLYIKFGLRQPGFPLALIVYDNQSPSLQTGRLHSIILLWKRLHHNILKIR